MIDFGRQGRTLHHPPRETMRFHLVSAAVMAEADNKARSAALTAATEIPLDAARDPTFGSSAAVRLMPHELTRQWEKRQT
jgi:hypothetical protein